MKPGDTVTIAAGIVIVIMIAVAVQSGGFFRAGDGESSPATVPAAATPFPVAPVTVLPADTPAQAIPSPVPTQARANPELYRIYYAGNPLSYPVFRLPENMGTFGAGDVSWKDPDIVPFAYIEEPRGGLTETFSIPYGLWRMNVSVEASAKPQYARFNMALCYAKDGTVLDGIEILNPGSAYRNIRVSNTELYLIISTQNVDRFRITFETPGSYYDLAAGT